MSTTLAKGRIAETRGRFVQEHPAAFVLAGAGAGFTLGVIARVWMRWISAEPEFSWAGTIAIMASFTVFGAAQSAAAAVRLRPARSGTVAVVRAVAALLSAGLFGAAGAVMFPTVLFGSLATWRSDARRVVRVLLALLALPSVALVLGEIADDMGWSIETVGRMLLFLCIYAVVIGATWPTVAPVRGGWRASRRVAVFAVCVAVVLLGLPLYLGGVE